MWPPVTSMILAGWLCVFPAVLFADSGNELYRKVGDQVVLEPGNAAVTGPITNIVWKDGPSIAIDWEGKDPIYRYRHFKTRGHLNTTSGEMTLTGLIISDTGLYTPEINGQVKTATRLIVFFPVPKPTVNKSCNDEMTTCTLTCDGNTTGAEPVTYSWMSGDQVAASSKELPITKNSSSTISEFSCELKNRVSQESSEPIPNPFPAPGQKVNVYTGLIVFICLLVPVLLLVVVHRFKAGMWFFQKTSMPWEADFWRKDNRPQSDAAASNGITAQERGQTDEETPMT